MAVVPTEELLPPETLGMVDGYLIYDKPKLKLCEEN
jgi:hypothetical protein